MITVYEYNLWEGAICHLNVRNTRIFDGCELSHIKEYLLVEGVNRLKLEDKDVDSDKVEVFMAFLAK